jgi:hypothetical protein
MAKQHKTRSAMTERVEIPKVAREKDGSMILLCPFCKIPHPLKAEGTSACGTRIKVTASQMIYDGKYAKGMVCVKCGKGGGKMVQYQNGYMHLEECASDIIVMTDPPIKSKLAEQMSKAPKWAKPLVEQIQKYTGRPTPIAEVMPDGTRTGNVLGWFFYKGT